MRYSNDNLCSGKRRSAMFVWAEAHPAPSLARFGSAIIGARPCRHVCPLLMHSLPAPPNQSQGLLVTSRSPRPTLFESGTARL